ncbi:hypothetical protein CKO44_23890 [Rubrivivax gelatinosus]|nr:hypothetical protein [Rubrivivax gelatinosus]
MPPLPATTTAPPVAALAPAAAGAPPAPPAPATDAQARVLPAAPADATAPPAAAATPVAAAEDTNAALVRQRATPAADAAAVPASAHATPATPAAPAEAGPALKLPAATTAWRQPLLQALGERLRLQVGGGAEQATIRLDPPLLGSIEIVVRHEAGAVQVHLSASHPDVQRQLQQLGEPLRHELAQRQGGEVSVEVARQGADADGRQRREPPAEAEAEVGRALAEADAEAGATPFTFRSRFAA